jgi:hypothetical protein
MKLTIETGTNEVIFLLPTITFIYDPTIRKFEFGGYLFKYFIALNVSIK